MLWMKLIWLRRKKENCGPMCGLRKLLLLTLLQNGQTLYQTKLDHTAIADNYITLSIPVQKPKKNMDENENIKNTRLALLVHVSNLGSNIADLTKIVQD